MKFIYYAKLFIKEHKKLTVSIVLFILLFPTIHIIDHVVYGAKVETSDELHSDSYVLVSLMYDDMNYKDPLSDFTKKEMDKYADKFGYGKGEMTENDKKLYRDVLELNMQYNKLLLNEFIGKSSMSEYDRIQELKQKLKDDYNID